MLGFTHTGKLYDSIKGVAKNTGVERNDEIRLIYEKKGKT